MIIVALDPGPDTGVAYLHRTDSLPGQIRTLTVYNCKSQEGLQKLIDLLDNPFGQLPGIFTTKPVTVVYEKWEFRKEMDERKQLYKAVDYTAPEVIGALRCWALHKRNVTLVGQGASEAKGRGAFWGDDAKLKKLDYWKSGSESRHEMDALRHLLTYITFSMNDTTYLRMLKDR